ncbi:MAG: hypothetical protein H0X62_02045 [Bacteroidetes bacterium]|nr:hypothetical protein [Bacteroidota bacterium]
MEKKPKEINEDIKEFARICAATIKKGGIVGMPSSAGLLMAAHFTQGPGFEKLLEFAKKLKEKIIIVTDKDEKLNYILHDIPSLAYSLIEHSEKPMIIEYDKPSLNIHKDLVGPSGTLPVMILSDELVSRTCNLGLKAVAAIIINTKNQEESLPVFSAILPDVEYMVDLPENKKPKLRTPSIISLTMSGEVKIIRK